MKRAIDETTRRRAKQVAFNESHGIEPVSIIKAVYDLTERLKASYQTGEKQAQYSGKQNIATMPKDEIKRVLVELENQMKAAAKELEFERAAALRDQILEIRSIEAEASNVPPWKKAQILSGELDQDIGQANLNQK
jgi:excinuclease ABC subunit B